MDSCAALALIWPDPSGDVPPPDLQTFAAGVRLLNAVRVKAAAYKGDRLNARTHEELVSSAHALVRALKEPVSVPDAPPSKVQAAPGRAPTSVDSESDEDLDRDAEIVHTKVRLTRRLKRKGWFEGTGADKYELHEEARQIARRTVTRSRAKQQRVRDFQGTALSAQAASQWHVRSGASRAHPTRGFDAVVPLRSLGSALTPVRTQRGGSASPVAEPGVDADMAA